jgi:hypothetical protein
VETARLKLRPGSRYAALASCYRVDGGWVVRKVIDGDDDRTWKLLGTR